ncbi:hypothetical protein [Carboxydothermus hydrogenoformans]|uniref:Uncharacterized protein n=1 Tax=Carboxydothermus hydrogenoformans (strain ATCC BAA-161 / DSM 6008 / Z-2901) TaxID=246194 RepID=Q3AA86_CARHZ|nr:hypothetical protein [Carboxydothermus hydrogenoformans]ABB14466.1 hypothetical protein CHY_2134 [Carboxydothermus hydrogenoformans Z-2901]
MLSVRSNRIKAKRKIILILVTLLILLIVTLNIKIFYLFQEGNPIPVLFGVARLEFFGERIALISSDGSKYIAKSEYNESLLNERLSKYGWKFKDRLGSGIFYEKDGETMVVKCRMFTRRYVIYELDRALW